jgi:hypothetical protein
MMMLMVVIGVSIRAAPGRGTAWPSAYRDGGLLWLSFPAMWLSFPALQGYHFSPNGGSAAALKESEYA